MGQGQDKIALSLLDLQPTAIVELFLLYFNTVDKENVFIAFHGGSVFQKNIKWQGIEYLPIPVESEGFEVNANGQMARPKIRISNKDYFITDLLLNNHDLQFAKIIRKRTFVKYLDDANFDGGNPWGQADSSAEISNDTFVVGQKTAENKVFVELELTSPLDLDNFDINNRLILSRYCSWYYRGNGCNYQGPPIETEDGRNVNFNIGEFNWYKASPWTTGTFYKSGDATYIENKKIIIYDKNDSNQSDYAKIWYVSQINHTGSYQKQPDLNETYWLRDGCGKKLDNCKKRFQPVSRGIVNPVEFSITNNYVNFSHKAGLFATNNIATQANITASSELSQGYRANNINNMQTGSGNNYFWASSGVAFPWVKLTWDSVKTINRIDLYDIPDTTRNFNNAYITFYNGASIVKSGVLSSIPISGNRITSGFANVNITDIIISGSGCSGSNVGLGEACIFEPSGLGLYSTNFNADSIHRSQDWHLASWIQFLGGISETGRYNNILHNVSTNCQSSGINLYIRKNKMVLDFATVVASGSPLQYIVTPQQLSIPWNSPQNLNPFHIICNGGKVDGLSPTVFNEGSIIISGGSTSSPASASYNLLKTNKKNKISGEFFLFKNINYQNGISNLKFGINDWQFSDSLFTPDLKNNSVQSNIKMTSNMLLGTTAIWTGNSYVQSRSDFFNRQDDDSKLANGSLKALTPRKYSEISGTNLNNLYVWWDMELPTYSPYTISGSNNSSKTINLSGQYTGSMNYSSGALYNTADTNPKSVSDFLPFGGFPGTDRYGR